MPDPQALPPIPRGPNPDSAFEAGALQAEGLAHLRSLAGTLWTDHNTHDPGITILETASYALTELAYRHTLPIQDLVMREEGAAVTAAQFHAPAELLTTRPWTAPDWRRAIIDLKGVKNAWIEPADVRLYADLLTHELVRDPPAHPSCKTVLLGGLQRVRIEFMDTVATQAERDEVIARVKALAERQRNLCEDVIDVAAVRAQYFALCAEVDLAPGTDVTEAAARLLFDIGEAIAPPVRSRPLAEALADAARTGNALPDLLDGPWLANGLIDEAELARAALPAELRLSDLIGVAMDVPGVRSVRELVLNPLKRKDEDKDDAPDAPPRDVVADMEALPNPWRIPVRPGRLPRLSLAQGRLVFTQRGVPVGTWFVAGMPPEVSKRLDALRDAARVGAETAQAAPPFSAGRRRELGAYRSLQADLPALYGIGPQGLPGRADKQRRAQARQLQGYLLLFDQWMADQLSLLARAGQRLSVGAGDLARLAKAWLDEKGDHHVLATQLVPSVSERLPMPYAAQTTAADLLAAIEPPADAEARQQRLLDHLLARVAEDFADYAGIVASASQRTGAQLIADKCRFLGEVAALSHDRAGGLQRRPATAAGVWDTAEVSGLERRLARLLGIADLTRRNLSPVKPGNDGEGLFVVEHILLRPKDKDDPLMPICADADGSVDDSDIDPYSWRVHVLLPAAAGRFSDPGFRRFVDDTLRREMPAHLLPTVCWIDAQPMAAFQQAWRDWLLLCAGFDETKRPQKLQALITALTRARNVYPPQRLFDCVGDHSQKTPFILGQNSLGP